ncbi:MAG: transglycosylase domain-containing protein [Caulobacteraceae bacterium]
MTTSDFPLPAETPARRAPGGGGCGIAIVVLCVVVAVIGVVGAVGAVIVNGYISDAPQIPSREALWTVRRSPGDEVPRPQWQSDRHAGRQVRRGGDAGAAAGLCAQGLPRREDRRFYPAWTDRHPGHRRAIETNFRKQRSAEGASTLTQQLARTLFLKREQSLKRKVQEAYLAYELEQGMSKDEILELYMNRTYFGDGAYGLDAASQTYFGKPASQLSLVEAATLAGLPNAPSRLALTNDMPDAVARGHRILATMRGEGWISDADLTAALATTPTLVTATHVGEGDEGYVLDQAASEAAQLSAGAAPDLVVKTTIDPALQTLGAATLRDVIAKQGAARRVSQGALVALAPDGAILAMVGGLDHDKSPFNRVVQAHRQPGSSFKAFVYGRRRWSTGAKPTDIRQDAPISYAGWNPENYGHGYAGAVTLASALARSLNTVAVRLTLEVGPDSVAEFARRLGPE